jgi:ubiquinone/menaquinone biosynthesis C-methylase UbiE
MDQEINQESNQEQVWNKIADKWKDYRNKPIQEVAEFLKGKKGKILDIGCGSGRNIFKIDNVEWYGVDFSDKMLKFAKEKAENEGIKAEISKQNLTNLNFDDEFFDYAIFISTLHCIQDEEKRRKALEELFRVLKKGGEAMISVWDKESNNKIKELEAKDGFVNWKKDNVNFQRYYYFYKEKELIDLLKNVGFTIDKIYKKDTKTLIGKHPRKNIVVFVKK